jgi:hypothetical protein
MDKAIASASVIVALACVLVPCFCTAETPRSGPPVYEAFPFPDDASDFALLTTLDRVRYQVSQLEPKIGSTPIRVKDADDRKNVFKIWKCAMLSALAVRQSEGNTELMLSTVAALYRQGMNLGVETCSENAEDTVETSLEMYPDSMLVNWQAAYLYALEPNNAPKAEAALMKLRKLLGTDKNYEVERRLAQLYASGNDKARALAQVERCLTLRPDDAGMLELRKTLTASAAK